MILSRQNIEEIASVLVDDYRAACRLPGPGETGGPAGVDIDRFAVGYLNLRINYQYLSPDNSFCGLTAFADTDYTYEVEGRRRTIWVPQSQILLNELFFWHDLREKLAGQRRFTVAHECAHQILYQMGEEEGLIACRRTAPGGDVSAPRQPRTEADWNEWQANALGAALLMPLRDVDVAMRCLAPGRRLRESAGWFGRSDWFVIKSCAALFGVSPKAITIRLRQLGYVEEAPGEGRSL